MNIHRQALYYLPGYISLLLLPLFFSIYLLQGGVFTPNTMIPVYCQRESTPAHAFTFKRPERKYYPICFTGVASADQMLLPQVARQVKSLRLEKNIRDGVHIQLGAAVKYQLFIQLLDMLHQDNLRYFQLTDKGIWVWYALSEPGLALGAITPLLMDDVVMPPFVDHAAEAAISAKMRSLLLELWPSWLLLAVLCYLNLQQRCIIRAAWLPPGFWTAALFSHRKHRCCRRVWP